MSLASRLAASPNDAYWALSTADAKFPSITLSNGETVTVSYGQYRAILATRREQADREKAFTALHETYRASLNTYATLYNAVCQRDWFNARARGYKSTLEAALHGKLIPDHLERLFRCLDEMTKRCPHENCNKRLPLAPMIVHLNDDHRWTREQIADWLSQESVP